MSEKKANKRAVRAVWDEVKALRSDRGKSFAAGDILAAGDELAQLATKLTALGNELSALSAMPAGDAEKRPPRQRKRKKSKASEE